MILQRIASNDLDPKRAGLLLYGLQIASLNLPKQVQQDERDAPELVEEITTHPELGTIAPETEIHEKKNSIQILLEELRGDHKPKPATLPLIQATASPTLRMSRSSSRRLRRLRGRRSFSLLFSRLLSLRYRLPKLIDSRHIMRMQRILVGVPPADLAPEAQTRVALVDYERVIRASSLNLRMSRCGHVRQSVCCRRRRRIAV